VSQPAPLSEVETAAVAMAASVVGAVSSVMVAVAI
jgi:hypothetical protein